MTFLVFFTGAAGAWIVAADFSARAHGLGRFGLSWAGLILQIFLLTRLAALDLPRDFGKMLRLAGARGGTRGGSVSTHWMLRTRRLRPGLRLWLLALLYLNV